MAYQRYAIGTILTGLGAAAMGQLLWPADWAFTDLLLLTAVALATAVTRAYPLKVSPQAEASIAGAPIFLAVLLLSTPSSRAPRAPSSPTRSWGGVPS